MSTLAELTTPLTVDEIKTAIYAALAANGAATTTWKPGAVVRTIITGVAIVLAGFSRLQAAIAKSGFLGLAEGDWLTLVAFYVYDVTRDTGSFATGNVTLDNAGGGVYSGDPGDLVVMNPTTLQTYTNTAAYSIDALETGVIVPVQAVLLGADGTSTPGTITAFVTPLSGVTVTNAAAVVGSDAELDPALRIRCREKTGMLSPNGPRDAYAYVAKTTTRSDGSSIGVTRVKSVADGIGGVDVYCADADGVVTGTVGDLGTDLGVIDEAIQTQVVPLGITARVHTAVANTIAVTYELWLRDTTGLTDDEIGDLVDAALTAFMSTQPIGGELLPGEATGRVYRSAIESVIGAAVLRTLLASGVVDMATLTTIKVAVTVPAGDTDIDVDEAPILGTVTRTAIHQVAGVD